MPIPELLTSRPSLSPRSKNGVLDYKEFKSLLLTTGLPVLLSELLLSRFVKNQFFAFDFS